MKWWLELLFNRSSIFAILDRFSYQFVRVFFGSVWKVELGLRGVRPFFGPSMHIVGRPMVAMAAGSAINIGENVILMSSSRYCLSASLYAVCKIQTLRGSASIKIESGVSLNGTSIVCRSTSVQIGARTMIGPNVSITDSPFHPTWPPLVRNIYPGTELDQPVEIGDDVWVCSQVIILPGSRIGSGSVIAAGSVVRGEIPGNCLAAGSPARVIRYFEGV